MDFGKIAKKIITPDDCFIVYGHIDKSFNGHIEYWKKDGTIKTVYENVNVYPNEWELIEVSGMSLLKIANEYDEAINSNGKISVEQYVALRKLELATFESNWKENSIKNPEEYVPTLSQEDWYEQELAYMHS